MIRCKDLIALVNLKKMPKTLHGLKSLTQLGLRNAPSYVIYVVTRNGVQQPQSDYICMRLEVISKAIKEHLSIGENWLRATQK